MNQAIEYKLLTERESKLTNEPYPGWYKLNINRAFTGNDATGGLGGIFRNQNGD